MGNRNVQTTIMSIFGQMEEVVARAMVQEEKARMIPLTEFPDRAMCPEVWTNEAGQPAKFAIQLSRPADLLEFSRRVADLRA